MRAFPTAVFAVCVFAAVLVETADPVTNLPIIIAPTTTLIANSSSSSSSSSSSTASAAATTASSSSFNISDANAVARAAILWGSPLPEGAQWNPRACVLAQNMACLVLALCILRLSMNALHRNQSIFEGCSFRARRVRACVRACVARSRHAGGIIRLGIILWLAVAVAWGGGDAVR